MCRGIVLPHRPQSRLIYSLERPKNLPFQVCVPRRHHPVHQYKRSGAEVVYKLHTFKFNTKAPCIHHEIVNKQSVQVGYCSPVCFTMLQPLLFSNAGPVLHVYFFVVDC